jgi:hypothetical protein
MSMRFGVRSANTALILTWAHPASGPRLVFARISRSRCVPSDLKSRRVLECRASDLAAARFEAHSRPSMRATTRHVLAALGSCHHHVRRGGLQRARRANPRACSARPVSMSSGFVQSLPLCSNSRPRATTRSPYTRHVAKRLREHGFAP